MTETLVARFGDAEGAADATRALDAAALIPGRDYEVLSAHPYPEGAFGIRPRRSRVPYVSLGGGAIGLVAGLALAAGTALDYPLVTRGMPIVAPTVSVIAYELMMLGILLAAFAGMLYEMRLPRLGRLAYDPRVSGEEVIVLVRCGDGESVARLEKMLTDAGASGVQRTQEPFG